MVRGVVDGHPTNGAPWVTGMVTVAVMDGRLTVSNAQDSVSNVINSIEIYSFGDAYAHRWSEENIVVESTTNTIPDYVYDYTNHYDRGCLVQDERFIYTWDDFNRITEVEDTFYVATNEIHQIPQTVTYLYDSLGRRIARRYSGHDPETDPDGRWADERAVYDGLVLIEERSWDTGDLHRRYFYDNAVNRPVVVQEDKNGNNQVDDSEDKTYILITDDRGTLMGVADSSGAIIEKLYYNSTGLTQSFEEDESTKMLDANGNRLYKSKLVRFGFCGMYREPLTGKYHTHFRDYDPVHSMWLSRDPIAEAGGINLTGFGYGDAINNFDPYGLSAISWMFGFGYSGNEADEFDISLGTSLIEMGGGMKQGVKDTFNGKAYVRSVKSTAGYMARTSSGEGGFIGGAKDITHGVSHLVTSAVGIEGLLEASTGVSIVEDRELSGMERTSRGLIGGGQAILTGVGLKVMYNPSATLAGSVQAAKQSIKSGLKSGKGMPRHPGRQLSRRLERLGYDRANRARILRDVRAGRPVTVVGENMKRVNAVRKMVDRAGGMSRPVPKGWSKWTAPTRHTIEANRSWVRYWTKNKGATVIDIGRQATPRRWGPSMQYWMENNMLHKWDVYTPFNYGPRPPLH